MAGRGQDLARTRELAGDSPAVEWIDWVERDELPALVFEHDICLGIFSPGVKGMRVIPNKVFQGAAAGCADRHLGLRLRSGRRWATRPASSSRATRRRSPTRCAGSSPTASRCVTLRQARYRRAVEASRPPRSSSRCTARLQAGVRKRR
jgi:hypothetical protein